MYENIVTVIWLKRKNQLFKAELKYRLSKYLYLPNRKVALFCLLEGVMLLVNTKISPIYSPIIITPITVTKRWEVTCLPVKILH